MRVLVVEDEKVAARWACAAVEAAGHTARVVQTGEAAWDLLRAGPGEPSAVDAVLCDWFLPGLSGPELCQRLTGLPDFVPLIYTTGMSDPVERIAGMRAGAVGFLAKPLDRHELSMQLISAERLVGLHRKLAAREGELKRLVAELHAEARHDTTTGIPNRTRFDEDAAALYSRALAQGRGWALAMVDIDHFKPYNDTFGHIEGDAVLRRIAASLASSTRASDAVYRFGGEEFVLLLQAPDPAVATRVLERLRAAVEELQVPHQHGVAGRVTVSAGVATWRPAAPIPLDTLLRRADEALYAAKRHGRNRVIHYDALTRTARTGEASPPAILSGSATRV